MKTIKLQASSANIFNNCSGPYHYTTDKQVNLYEGVANIGSRIHDIAEDLLCQHVENGKHITIAKAIKEFNGYDREKARDSLTTYLHWFKKELKRMQKIGDVAIHIEEKFRESIENLELVFKADSLLRVETGNQIEVTIFDLKTGNYDYSESAIHQLYFSAMVLALQTYQKEENQDKDFIFNLCIAQGNFWKSDFKGYKEQFEINFNVVIEYFERLFYFVNNPENIHAGSHCKFCPAVLTCPKMQGVNDLIQTTSMLNIQEVSIEVLERIYLHKEQIENYLKSVEKYLHDILEDGTVLKNVCLKPSYGNRRWKDEKEVAKRLDYLGDKIYNKKLKSPAQIEKIAGKENIADLYEKPEYLKLAKLESSFDKIEG